MPDDGRGGDGRGPAGRSAAGRSLERILAGIAESATDNVYAFDTQMRYLYVNEAGARLLGLRPEQLIGRTLEEVLPADSRERRAETIARVLRTREPVREEVALPSADGVERYFEYVLSPVLDDHGQVDLLVSIGRDMTARRRAEMAESRARVRATKLQRISATLARATTREEIAAALVDQAADAVQAAAAVAYFAAEDGSFVLAGARGVPAETAQRLRVLPLDHPAPLATALRTNGAVWIETPEALVAMHPRLGQAEIALGSLQAVAALPIAVEGRVVAGMAFTFSAPQAFDTDERTFLLTLADYAAVALERARLSVEERAATNRLTILAEASRRFSEAALDLPSILDTVTREVAKRLRDSCAINLLSADGATLDPVAVHALDPEAEASTRATMAAAPVRLDEESALARVARSGQAILVPVVSLEALLAGSRPEYRRHLERFPIGSLLIVPLRVHEIIIGTMTVSRDAGGPTYTERDRSLLQDLADRAAFAISNARQYEELRLERQRLALVATASEVLARSQDYQANLRKVVEVALPMLGDHGFFDVVLDEQGGPRRIEAGQPPAASPSSSITVPLIYRGKTLGSLTLAFSSGARTHGEADVQLAREIARRAAAALDNTRLVKELQQAVAVRDDFLSIASHELNTPLTALQLQMHSLRRQIQRGEATAALLARLTTTEGNVTRLGKLVKELLDVSRITAARLTIEREGLDLVATVRDVADRFTAEAATAGCPIAFRAPRPVTGTWDRLRVEQVVTNLLSNAIKYGGGKPIEIDVEAAGAVARVSVRDHGIGISPADEERVFGRFERAVSERHYGGFGLGLWIARQIVEAHDGNIRFERPPDAGTRFIVELPLDRPR